MYLCTEFHCNHIILIFSSADHQNIEANLINLNTVVRSMYGSMNEFRAEVKNDINSLREDLNALNDSVSYLSVCLQEHKKCLQDHKEQTTAELAHLQTTLKSTQSSLETKLDSLTATTAQLSSDHQQIQANISDVECLDKEQSLELHQNMQDNITHQLETLQQYVAICTNCTLPSGPMTTSDPTEVTTVPTETTTVPTEVTTVPTEVTTVPTEITTVPTEVTTVPTEATTVRTEVTSVPTEANYTCGGTGGWRRAVYLDTTDSSTTCPSGWQLTGYSKMTCGRNSTGTTTCDSAIFPVTEGPYSSVCGRIRAYQWGGTDAFQAYNTGQATTIDTEYVEGVSVTHGTPRNHIWTFAAGAAEGTPKVIYVCPCDASIDIRIPPFVGEDYFCESGVNEPWDGTRHQHTFHSNDTLWDGEDCLPSSTCCSRRNPPYFVKQLLNSTADDIEARICSRTADRGYDNIAIELIEFYVK